MRNRIIVAALAMALPFAALAEDYAPAVQVRALAGYRAFSQKSARDLIRGGPAYGAALDLGLGPWAALEGSWLGSTFGEKGPLVFGNQRIMQNEASAVLKLGPRYGAAEPYVFGGVGYSWIRNTSNDPSLRDTSYWTVPVGVGIDARLASNVTIGARGAYEFGYGKDLYGPAALSTSNRTDEFMVLGSLGFRF